MLLNAAWNVLAIDREPRAIARVAASATDPPAGRADAVISCFEELGELAPSTLIHAALSLAFCCTPANFPRLWALIVSALEPGVQFAAHFFGDRHDWAGDSETSFRTKDEVAALQRLECRAATRSRGRWRTRAASLAPLRAYRQQTGGSKRYDRTAEPRAQQAVTPKLSRVGALHH